MPLVVVNMDLCHAKTWFVMFFVWAFADLCYGSSHLHSNLNDDFLAFATVQNLRRSYLRGSEKVCAAILQRLDGVRGGSRMARGVIAAP
jgi:hypothetical protein